MKLFVKRSLPSLLLLLACFWQNLSDTAAEELSSSKYYVHGGHFPYAPDYNHHAGGKGYGPQDPQDTYYMEGASQPKQTSYLKSVGWSQPKYGLASETPDAMQLDCDNIPSVGGNQPAQWMDAPYMVSLRDLRNDRGGRYGMGHFCSGTILSQYIIVTSASCLYNRQAKDLGVVVGTLHLRKETRSTQLLFVQRTITHSLYKPGSLGSDIGALVLKTPIEFGPYVKSISLGVNPAKTGANCAIYGWGKITLNRASYGDCLLKSYVKVLNPIRCVEAAKPGTICVEEEGGTCLGDIGAPMACNGTLVGIVLEGSCGDRRTAKVYTDVYRFKYWIEREIKEQVDYLVSSFPHGALGSPRDGRQEATAGTGRQIASVGFMVLSLLGLLL